MAGIISNTPKRLPLPIGVSEFEEVAGSLYYIDKTLMIRDLIDDGAKAMLFTRPRRFGKSLTMGMLRCFFDVPRNGEDTRRYFRERKIWSCGQQYTSHQGAHPVVSLSLKGARCDDWSQTYETLRGLVFSEADRARSLIDESSLDRTELEALRRLWEGTATEPDLRQSLRTLTSALAKSRQAGTVVLIDEYDVPISHGFHYGFYDEAVDFMRVFLGEGLKDNPNLYKGVLTGVLRVAKEGMFSGFNNPQVYTVLDDRYAQYFGLTPDEVQELLVSYGYPEKLEEVSQWYDGYRFGQEEVYNPWSVLKYVDAGCKPRAYWTNTSENSALAEIARKSRPGTLAKIHELLEGRPVVAETEIGTVYPRIADDPGSVWGYLLMTGYLNGADAGVDPEVGEYYRLEIPNREVRMCYRREVLAAFEDRMPRDAANPVADALIAGDPDSLRVALARLLECASVRDLWGETFYQGFVLGLAALLDGFGYQVDSNREAGDGYFDIQLDPRETGRPGIVIEIKAVGKAGREDDTLGKYATKALRQIIEKHYAAELSSRRVSPIIAYGVAFCDRNVAVVSDVLEAGEPPA